MFSGNTVDDNAQKGGSSDSQPTIPAAAEQPVSDSKVPADDSKTGKHFANHATDEV